MEIYEPIVILNRDRITFDPTCRIDSFVKLEGGLDMFIGSYVHIASFAHVGIGGGRTTLMSRCMIASGAKILSGTNTKEGHCMSSAAPKHEQRVRRLHTIIGCRAFIGAGAIVLPGLVICEDAIVGAGAVVTKNVPANEIWAGNPARKIGER